MAIIDKSDRRQSESRYRGVASLLRPPSNEFQCSESTSLTKDGETNSAGVSFRCTVSKVLGNESEPRILTFYCREPSYGVLTSDEPAAAATAVPIKVGPTSSDDIGDDFDFGWMLFSDEKYPYALAGRTGFQIWPGTRILVDALTYPRPGDPMTLQKWQAALGNGDLRVLELGAGVGVVGTSLAAAGAQVLMTDLPQVVTQSLIPNLYRNSGQKQPACNRADCPTWLGTVPVVPMGLGWTAAVPLDWTEPLNDQLSPEQCSVDLIIASDCVWLASMLDGLLATTSAIFRASTVRSPRLLLSFQRRDCDMFTSVDRVLADIRSQNWTVECLAWYPVTGCDDDDDDLLVNGSDCGSNDSVIKEVFIFEVCPNACNSGSGVANEVE